MLLVDNVQFDGGNDLRSTITVRWKAAGADDSAYVISTAYEEVGWLIVPYFDENDVPTSGDYIVHTYLSADGPSTGTKITVTVDKDVPVPPGDCEEYYNNTSSVQIVNFDNCDTGDPHTNVSVNPGQSICVAAGSLSGPGAGYLVLLGPCFPG